MFKGFHPRTRLAFRLSDQRIVGHVQSRLQCFPLRKWEAGLNPGFVRSLNLGRKAFELCY